MFDMFDMLMTLTDISSESLQSQIVRQIRAGILAGELKADTSLPSIRALAAEQRVSVITVQRAYEHLEREGLIHSRRGKGFFVSALPAGEKKAMARQRLAETIGPQISAALSEGLSGHDIRAIIESALKKNGAGQGVSR
jgi:GntR family transcriptional regulator